MLFRSPDELRAVSIGGPAGAHEGQALASLVAQLLALIEALRRERPEGRSASASP